MKLPTHISFVLKKSFYLLSWKSLSCIKFLNWKKYFPMEFKYFSNTLFILNGRSHVIFSLGFCIWKEFEFKEIKVQNESLGKSFYSLSFNFQKISNSTHFQSINQTINPIYLFIITFQNLEFWDVTECCPRNLVDRKRKR